MNDELKAMLDAAWAKALAEADAQREAERVEEEAKEAAFQAALADFKAALTERAPEVFRPYIYWDEDEHYRTYYDQHNQELSPRLWSVKFSVPGLAPFTYDSDGVYCIPCSTYNDGFSYSGFRDPEPFVKWDWSSYKVHKTTSLGKALVWAKSEGDLHAENKERVANELATIQGHKDARAEREAQEARRRQEEDANRQEIIDFLLADPLAFFLARTFLAVSHDRDGWRQAVDDASSAADAAYNRADLQARRTEEERQRAVDAERARQETEYTLDETRRELEKVRRDGRKTLWY